MRKWSHNCDINWLRARQKVVTATELKELKAAYDKATKAELFGDKVNTKVAGLWAEKQATDLDTYSSGPAARGHILESYAVAECNNMLGTKFVWWDDFLISSGFVGFSPDALDVPQPLDTYSCHYSELANQPEHMLEIKSYGPKNHVASCLTKHGSHQERWQLAGAMLVCPTIKDACLFFYNPDLAHACHPVIYERADLESEIDTLREIQAWVYKQFALCDQQLPGGLRLYTEEDIYKEFQEEQRLDSAFAIK